MGTAKKQGTQESALFLMNKSLLCFWWKSQKNWKWPNLLICSFIPQKYIWQAAIAIHTGPRILFEYIYNQIFLERLTYLTSGTRRLIRIAFWLAIVEILCLLGLSIAPSQDEFEVHKLCFGAFIATFLGYMVTTLYLLNYCGFKPQNRYEPLLNLYQFSFFPFEKMDQWQINMSIGSFM